MHCCAKAGYISYPFWGDEDGYIKIIFNLKKKTIFFQKLPVTTEFALQDLYYQEKNHIYQSPKSLSNAGRLCILWHSLDLMLTFF